MVKWHSEDEVYVGDMVGNALPLRIGVVQVGRRVTVGIQHKNASSDQPAYTLDLLAIQAMITALTEQRSELMKRSGGL